MRERVDDGPPAFAGEPARDVVPVLESWPRAAVETVVAPGVPERRRVHVDELRRLRAGREALRSEERPRSEESVELDLERGRRGPLARPTRLVGSRGDNDRGECPHDLTVDFGREERVPDGREVASASVALRGVRK